MTGFVGTNTAGNFQMFKLSTFGATEITKYPIMLNVPKSGVLRPPMR